MNPNAQQPQLARVNVHELMERFRSKKELYDFLSKTAKLTCQKSTVSMFTSTSKWLEALKM